jgi:hypothetical protein
MVAFAAAGVLLVGAGCGDSFTATTGSGASTNAGGGGATGGGGAGGSTTTTTTMMAECTDGQSRDCYTGPNGTEGVGACKGGKEKCKSGKWSGVCEGQVTPADKEICDGLDNDCNHQTDEGCKCTDGTTQGCGIPKDLDKVGICKLGTQTCTGGMWGTCNGAVGPTTETCNNKDDDCNGTTDDIAQSPCSTGKPGVCAQGTNQCSMGVQFCHQDNQPSDEVCDGLDNNCDGPVDNISPTPCMFGDGAMKCPGTTHCTGNPNKPTTCVLDTLFLDPFPDNDNKWEPQGQWQIGPTLAGIQPGFGNKDPAMDHTQSSNDNRVAGIVLGGNASINKFNTDYLTMKDPIDTSGLPKLYVAFWRWLNTTAGYVDSVEVFDSETQTWVPVWSNGPAFQPDPNVTDSQWTFVYYDVSQYAGQSFRVRVGHGAMQPAGPPLITVSSWNIDDFVITQCIPM